jgi:hypothetical protein
MRFQLRNNIVLPQGFTLYRTTVRAKMRIRMSPETPPKSVTFMNDWHVAVLHVPAAQHGLHAQVLGGLLDLLTACDVPQGSMKGLDEPQAMQLDCHACCCLQPRA